MRLLSGLKITINGKTLHPWKPKNFKRKEGIVSVKTRKLPYVFILTEKDIRMMLPAPVTNMLENYHCDLPTWENALFIVTEEKWDEFIVLEKNTIDEGFEGKLLRFKPNNKYTVEPFIDRRLL